MPQNRNLPDWLEGFLKYTETVETASIYRKWVGIMCLSSALQRKVKVDWGVGLKFYPNFYIILVGKSAAGKGTAMRPALDIMKEIPGIQLSAQATSLQALISKLKDIGVPDLKDGDFKAYHSSLTVYSEEFTVFLGYKNN